jgi:hypothetical protein
MRVRASVRACVRAVCVYSAADAVIGVAAFGSMVPAEFGAFDRAFVTMFRVLSGDTWVRPGREAYCRGLPGIRESRGGEREREMGEGSSEASGR